LARATFKTDQRFIHAFQCVFAVLSGIVAGIGGSSGMARHASTRGAEVHEAVASAVRRNAGRIVRAAVRAGRVVAVILLWSTACFMWSDWGRTDQVKQTLNRLYSAGINWAVEE
jgi:hypothetical protein